MELAVFFVDHELSVQAACEVLCDDERFLLGGEAAIRSVGVRTEYYPCVAHAVEFERNFDCGVLVPVVVEILVVFIVIFVARRSGLFGLVRGVGDALL